VEGGGGAQLTQDRHVKVQRQRASLFLARSAGGARLVVDEENLRDRNVKFDAFCSFGKCRKKVLLRWRALWLPLRVWKLFKKTAQKSCFDREESLKFVFSF